MRKLIVAVAIVILATGLACAADVPGKAPVYKSPAAVVAYNWSGLYVGINVGYGWTNSSVSQFPVSAAANTAFTSGSAVTPLDADPRGFLGGVQAGFNVQNGMIVYGIEADFSLTSVSGSASVTTPGSAVFIALNNSAEQQLDWFGTLRGRLGLMPGQQWLAYLTGGLAVGEAYLFNSLTGPNCAFTICPSTSTSEIKWGWTIGAGAERLLTDRWTFKVEYLYYDLGEISHSFVDTRSAIASLFVFGASADFSGHIVRIGLNYRFGSGPVGASY